MYSSDLVKRGLDPVKQMHVCDSILEVEECRFQWQLPKMCPSSSGLLSLSSVGEASMVFVKS